MCAARGITAHIRTSSVRLCSIFHPILQCPPNVKKPQPVTLQPNFCFNILQHCHTRATLLGHSDHRSSGSRLGSIHFCARPLPSQFPNGRLSSRFRSQRIQLRYSGGFYPISSSAPMELLFRAHDTIKWIMKLERSGKPLVSIISIVSSLSMISHKNGYLSFINSGRIWIVRSEKSTVLKPPNKIILPDCPFLVNHSPFFSAVFTTFCCDFM